MLLATLIFQVAFTAVYAIITQPSNTSTPIKFEEEKTTQVNFEDVSTSPRQVRKINGAPTKNISWKTILKDATLQSLIKHTAFTPSLEEKMESDRILWEKLQTAKFFRKANGKTEDANEQVRMGVLVDMTPDGGSLEFRQSDRSVYTCPDSKCEDVLRRLLAIWKVQRFEPNDIWIRIKVPKHNKEEDVYEYTTKYGLQQMNTRFSQNHNASKNKTVSEVMSAEDSISTEKAKTSRATEPILDERMVAERRIDYGRKPPIYDMKPLKAKDFSWGKGKFEVSGKYNPLSFPQRVPHPLQYTTDAALLNKNLYFEIKPVQPEIITVEPKVYKEFQNMKGNFYDGFLPSLGPTGSPYTTTINYVMPIPKFTEYTTKIKHDSGRQGNSNFKASPKFVQYSELDPIYHEDGELTFVQREIKNSLIGSTRLQNSSSIRGSNGNAAPSLKVINSNSVTKANGSSEPQEQTDSTISVSRFADTKGNEIQVTTKLPLRRVAVKPKNELKSIFKSTSSGEVQDYAPLYAKWGERLKTTAKPQHLTTTPKINMTTVQESTTEYTTTGYSETVTYPTYTTKSKNMIVENFEDKSPEEIVTTLTNMGVSNTTRIEGYPPVSEKTLETSTKILEKITKSDRPSTTDPISLIVNRISQSYSYMTSNGKVKNFTKMRRRL